jgi:hypothetical protein
MGSMVTPLAKDLQSDLAGTVKVVTVAIPYPAVPVLDAIDDGITGGVNYPASRIDGIVSLGDALDHEFKVCPSTWMVLAGYSQGADVVATYLANDATPEVLSRVAGVALFGDPRFNPADKAVDAGSFNPRYGPLYGRFGVPPDWTHPEKARPDVARALARKTISVCNKGDLICNYSWSNALGCVGVSGWESFYASIIARAVVLVPDIRPSCAHLHYADAGSAHVQPGQKVTVTAVAEFLATQVRVALNDHWGSAVEVPGFSALNADGDAGVQAVSCASAGNCSAGGYYTDSSGHSRAFVVSEINGTWDKAIHVPGIAALDTGGAESVQSVSCASAGNCVVGGWYASSSSAYQAFVVGEVNGTWGNAIEVPGTAALNVGRNAAVSVSCASAGNCSGSGTYTDRSGSTHAFVVSEVNGTWSKAIEVPGIAALDAGVAAQGGTVSCASAGNCVAAGEYQTHSVNEAFVVSEVNGTWGNAIQVPGTAALNVHGSDPEVYGLSCPSAGNCAMSGIYNDTSNTERAFVVSEVNGAWGNAREVLGTAPLTGWAEPGALSCASAGNCIAAGQWGTGSADEAFVVSEVNGTWGNAIEVPGTAALNVGGAAAVDSVSCASVGNCTVGGFYRDSSRPSLIQAFMASEVNGTWDDAFEVPGTASLNTGGNAEVDSVSCISSGYCAAAGEYTTSSSGEAFVVGERWSSGTSSYPLPEPAPARNLVRNFGDQKR